ncbi:hypothetical protein SPD48_16610 [Pseudogracilibacillus sp. SE30717A]|uniref:hypothetical protein n=1 Tax=Pseudogracilibacillus sp. SE30717A TaxID=3098293 RepID=UPI00300E1964
MFKKYICVGVLLGATVLAGCSANKEMKEQVTKDVNNGEKEEVSTLSNSENLDVVLVAPLKLTQEQKEDYHNQYVDIVNEINDGDSINHLEVLPLDEFKQEDWIEPEEFRKLAVDRASWEFTSEVFGGDPVD